MNRRRDRRKKHKYNPSGYQSNRAYMTDADIIYDNSGQDAYAPQHNGHYEMKPANNQIGYENYQYADEDPAVNHYKETNRPYGTSRPISNIVEGDAFPSPVMNNNR
jgi:hypothetical protein